MWKWVQPGNDLNILYQKSALALIIEQVIYTAYKISIPCLFIGNNFTANDQSNNQIVFGTSPNDVIFSFNGYGMGTGMISPRQRGFEVAGFGWFWNPVYLLKANQILDRHKI